MLRELRTREAGPHVLEPHTQGHSGQDESPGVEVNVTGSQAGQSHGDKGLIRAQTENSRPRLCSKAGDLGGPHRVEEQVLQDLGAPQQPQPRRQRGPFLQPPWGSLRGHPGSCICSSPGLLLNIYFPPTASNRPIKCLPLARTALIQSSQPPYWVGVNHPTLQLRKLRLSPSAWPTTL